MLPSVPFPTAELWRLTTPYACGGVLVLAGRIVGGAPIFSKLIGQPIAGIGYQKARVA